jgi:hypothetical protein
LAAPPVKTTPPGGTENGNAGQELNPVGGTSPYTYANGAGDAKCVAPIGSPAYQYLPASSNLVVNAAGTYSYTAPTTPGNYYFCVKVCDSSTPAICNVAVYKVNVPGDLPKFGATPPVQNPPAGGTGGGDAPSQLLPEGGTLPYTWSNGSGDAKCQAPAGYTPLPASSNLTITPAGLYTYTAPTIPGNYYFCLKVCDSSTPTRCNVWVQKVIVTGAGTGLVTTKVLLRGAVPATGTVMTTSLNTLNLIPTTDPYGKGFGTTAAVLTANSVTDWVLVELRSTPGTVIESIAALVKNDGSIINADGTLPLKFATTSGDFYLSVRHRNHLGVMTAAPITISTTTQIVDFTNPSTATYGANAQTFIPAGTLKAMWAGNASGMSTGTDNVRYTAGAGGDFSAITNTLLSNGGTGAILSGYRATDANLDGVTRYSGASSDVGVVRSSVLNHPVNSSKITGYVVLQNF